MNVINLMPTNDPASALTSTSVRSSNSWLPDDYADFPDGIHSMSGDDGSLFVCSPLRVEARFANSDNKGWGVLVSIKDPDGKWQEVPFLKEDITCKGSEVIAKLVNHGLQLGRDRKSKALLLGLLQQSSPQQRMTSVSRPGWVDEDFSAFIVGDVVLGQKPVLSLMSASQRQSAALHLRGTVDSWRTEVGEKCKGNPMMVLAVSLAFSAPLLKVSGMLGGGLHFRGLSSSGKSTLLRLAASVWGSPGLVSQWRATSNGLEGLAASCNDLLLPLDEIGEIAPGELDKAIYMLANGKGKTRMTRDADLNEAAIWRLALISSGEVSIREQLAKLKLTAMEGQEVRLIDIIADDRRFGVFDELHEAPDPGSFANSIQAATTENFGAAGQSFIKGLMSYAEKHADFSGWLDRAVKVFQNQALATLSRRPDGITGRVAERFALIGLAGELATLRGLTGWQTDDAKATAISAFQDWHERWVGDTVECAEKSVHKLQAYLAASSDLLPVVKGAVSDGTEIGWEDADQIYLPKGTWQKIFPGDSGRTAADDLFHGKVLNREGRRDMRRTPRDFPGRERMYTLVKERLRDFSPL
jgi:putative DNA primase/helicase